MLFPLQFSAECYRMEVSDASWAANKVEKVAKIWLVTNERSEEETVFRRCDPIVLIEQDNSET